MSDIESCDPVALRSEFAHPERLDIADFLSSMGTLIRSTEPAVVFTSLAQKCVPSFSDRCTIDITEANGSYRIDYPQVSPGEGPAEPTSRHTIRTAIRGVDDDELPFAGVVEHAWHEHRSNELDVVLARLIVDHAAAAVSQERLAGVARAAEDEVMHLGRALTNSRQIGTAVGVLMALHKITEADAFELLRTQSQRRNRKLHELAAGVVETGYLDQS